MFLTGCGSGKYLSVNPLLFNIGVDRCKTLTELAREKDNEVGGRRLLYAENKYFSFPSCFRYLSVITWRFRTKMTALTPSSPSPSSTTSPPRSGGCGPSGSWPGSSGSAVGSSSGMRPSSRWSTQQILSSDWSLACGAWSRDIGGSSPRTS